MASILFQPRKLTGTAQQVIYLTYREIYHAAKSQRRNSDKRDTPCFPR
jgi:hypothetical protein